MTEYNVVLDGVPAFAVEINIEALRV